MMASIGLPGFANFWGELTIFIALWHWNPVVMVLALIGIVISAIYGLRAVAAIAFGQPSEAFQEVQKEHPVSDLPWKDRIPAIILLVSLVLFGLFPSLAMDPINAALSEETLRPVSSIPSETLEALPAESLLFGSATDTTK
jgi:NADH-quinone oxidoreductase subunit M